MVICCPFCGKSGALPKRFRDGVHAVRCRRCKSRFSTSAVVDDGWSEPRDDDSVELEPGSSDSQYELPVAGAWESGFDQEIAGREEAGPRVAGAWAERILGFSSLLSRLQRQAALVFGGGSTLVIGGLLVWGFWSEGGVGSSTVLLVLGLSGVVGFVWLALTAAVLFAAVSDLAQALDRLAPGGRRAAKRQNHDAAPANQLEKVGARGI